MKTDRQNAIIGIIDHQMIETQQQLMDALAEQGVISTQATLSRDIRQLKLEKKLSPDGRPHYVLPAGNISEKPDEKLQSVFRQSLISVDTAQNLIVLHTYPGLASAACAALDSMEIPGIVGTLAGDDTAFIAMKNNQFAETLAETIHELG